MHTLQMLHTAYPTGLCYTRMWADAQCDGRPAEYRWRPVFNATKFGDAHYYSAVQ